MSDSERPLECGGLVLTWTCAMAAEQLDTLKGRIAGHLEEAAALDNVFLEKDTPDIDKVAYAKAMAFHHRMRVYLLSQWAANATHDGTMATSTINWSNIPQLGADDDWCVQRGKKWTQPEMRDYFWSTLRAIPLDWMSSFDAGFNEAVALLDAVDHAEPD